MVDRKTVERIKAAIEVLDISQAELARRADVDPGTITKILNYPNYQPAWDKMCRIADILGLSLDSLREP